MSASASRRGINSPSMAHIPSTNTARAATAPTFSDAPIQIAGSAADLGISVVENGTLHSGAAVAEYTCRDVFVESKDSRGMHRSCDIGNFSGIASEGTLACDNCLLADDQSLTPGRCNCPDFLCMLFVDFLTDDIID